MTRRTEFTIACLSGDGVGAELMAEASRALAAVSHLHGFELEQVHLPFAAEAVTRSGHPLPRPTRAACGSADAVLVGALGSPALDGLRAELDPWGVVTRIRTWPRGDLTVFAPAHDEGELWAVDRAFRTACTRHGAIGCVSSSRSFMDTFDTVADTYPGVRVRKLSLGEALSVLLSDPGELDVLVTEHVLFEALASLPRVHDGGRKVVAVGYVSPTGPGLFVPTHGPAADIAGQGVANPSELLLAAALLLGEGLERRSAAETLEDGVVAALAARRRPADMADSGVAVTTREFSDRVLELLPGSRRDTELPLGFAV
jgi:3-isopropylmalate dehydrogenase